MRRPRPRRATHAPRPPFSTGPAPRPTRRILSTSLVARRRWSRSCAGTAPKIRIVLGRPCAAKADALQAPFESLRRSAIPSLPARRISGTLLAVARTSTSPCSSPPRWPTPRARSKWLEAAMFGIPSVVSDTAAMRAAIDPGHRRLSLRFAGRRGSRRWTTSIADAGPAPRRPAPARRKKALRALTAGQTATENLGDDPPQPRRRRSCSPRKTRSCWW